MAKIHVSLEQQKAPRHFIATNDKGVNVDIDDPSSYPDGVGHGMSPMQLVLVAIGSCSALDVVHVLSKGRQQVDSFRIDVTGDKPDDVSPSPYESIQLTYALEGEIDPAKARRAVDLSLGKYCSVARMLEKSARLSYALTLNGEMIAEEEMPAP